LVGALWFVIGVIAHGGGWQTMPVSESLSSTRLC
jgi:chromate transport protein ChrA